MAFGVLGTMVAYSIGGELTRKLMRHAASGIGKSTKRLMQREIPKMVASGKALKKGSIMALAKRNRVAWDNFRLHRSREVGRQQRTWGKLYKKLEERTGSVKKAMTLRPSMARRFGVRKAWARKAIIGTVKDEAAYLPFSYLSYKYEKYQGSVDQDTGFAKYYFGQTLPLTLGAGVGLRAAGRGMKANWYKFQSAGGRYIMGAAIKSTMETVDALRKGTQQFHNAIGHSMSRLHTMNARTGFYSGVLKGVKKLLPKRDAQRPKQDYLRVEQMMDKYQYDPGTRKEIWKGYNRTMGKSSFTKFYNRALKASRRLSDRTLGTGGAELGDLKLSHAKTLTREGERVVASREMYTLGGDTYDFGHFHIDRLRDTMSKFITRDFRVAGRPWLKYIDAGRNLIMSQKTRWMNYQFREASTPGYLGLAGFQGLKVGQAGDVESLINENPGTPMDELANLIGERWFGKDSDLVRSYHENRIEQSIRYLKDAPRLAKAKGLDTREAIRNTYYSNFIANAREGIFELGTGESINLLTGKATVVTPYMNTSKGHRVPLTFHYNGTPIEVHSAVKGGTRMGQMYALMDGGGERKFRDSSNNANVRVGMAVQRNTKRTDKHFMPDRGTGLMAKIADFLEIGGGHETSAVSHVASIFTKWSDDTYFPTWIRKTKYQNLTKDRIYKKMTTETRLGTRGRFIENITSAARSASKELLDDVYESFMNVASLKQGQTDQHSNYSSLFSAMEEIMQPALRDVYPAVQNEIKFSRYAIEMGDSTDTAISKIGELLEVANIEKDLFAEAGMDIHSIETVQDHLYKSDLDDAWEAVSHLTQGNVSNILEHYNKTLYDTALDMTVVTKNREVRSRMSEFLVSVQRESAELRGRGPGKLFGRDYIDRDTLASAIYLKAESPKYTRRGQTLYEQDAKEFVDELMPMAAGFDKYMQSRKFRTILKPRPRKTGLSDPESADHFTVIIPKEVPGAMSGNRINIKHIGDDQQRSVLQSPMAKESLETMAAVGTMNSALGFLGMGFDVATVPTMSHIILKTLTHRVLPFAGVTAAADSALSLVGSTVPFFEDTSLAGGLTGLAMDAYAGARTAAQYISDFTGLTTMAQEAEELFPGIVTSPLSGFMRGVGPVAAGVSAGYMTRVGPKRGGLIGGAVGALLGGGPLGMFGCLVPEELVATETGFKEIQNIEEGDLVYTSEGRLKRVLGKKVSSMEGKSLYSITPAMVPRDFTLTGNHALLVSDKSHEEWKRTEDITVDDFLVFPAKRRRKRGNIDLSWYTDVPLLVEGESAYKTIQLLSPVSENDPRKNKQYRLPKKSEPEKAYMWPNAIIGRFIGWYLAEGSQMRKDKTTGISLAYDYDKEYEYVREVVSEASEYLPMGKITHTREECETGVSGKCNISGTTLASVMEGLCGGVSYEKRIHQDLMEVKSDAFLLGLIGGLIDGDGCIYTDDRGNLERVSFSTTSYNLAYDLWRLLAEFGVVSSVSEFDNYLNSRKKRKKIILSIGSREAVVKIYELLKEHSYKIASGGEPTPLEEVNYSNTRRKYAYIKNEKLYIGIRKIEKLDHESIPVYDIEVEDDSSFLGFGVTYHNSWDISKGREQVIGEFTGEREVEVRKGRWWELCLLGDALVYTSNKGFTKIVDVEPGDKVVNHLGQEAEVSATSRNIKERVHTIKNSRNLHINLSATTGHPIWIRRKGDNTPSWIDIEKAELGDEIAYPKRKREKKSLSVTRYVNTELPTVGSTREGYTYLKRYQYTKSGTLSCNGSRALKVGRDGQLNFTYNLGLIFGHYLGDGDIFRTQERVRGIEFAFDEPEREKAEVVRVAMREVFGIETEIETVKNSRMLRLRYLNPILGEIFDSLFQGKKKVVPHILYEVKGDDFYKGLLSGLIDSDGTIHEKRRIVFNNTNINIIHIYWYSLLLMGLYPTVNEIKDRERNGYKKVWYVYLRKEDSKKLKERNIKFLKEKRLEFGRGGSNTREEEAEEYIREDESYWYFKITDMSWEDKEVEVYDICVPEGHSFTGFWETYHNSTDSFLGEKVSYFRPSLYFLQKKKYKQGDNYLGDDLMTSLTSYVDPSVYARQHYYSRPYLESGGIFSNMPILGSTIGALTGGESYHQEYRNEHVLGDGGQNFGNIVSSAVGGAGEMLGMEGYGPGEDEGTGNYYYYGGELHTGISDTKPPVYAADSFEVTAGSTAKGLLDIAGLRGFLLGTFLDSALGAENIFSGNRHTETAGRIGSTAREYWNMELGGILGLCFVPGTEVRTKEGRKKIEDISPGDIVLSKGGYRKVLGSLKRPYRGERMLKVTTEKGISFTCTDNHVVPYIRRDTYVNGHTKPFEKKFYSELEGPVSELQTDDFLYYAIDQEEEKVVLDLEGCGKYTTQEWIYARAEPGYAQAYEIIERSPYITRGELRDQGIEDQKAKEALRSYREERSIKRYPRYIPVDKDVAYLIGWYLAEGSSDGTGVQFVLSLDEKKYAKRIERIASKRLFSNTSIREIPEKGTIVVRINNSTLARYFKVFGQEAANKHIPEKLKRLPKFQLLCLVDGLLQGDGWRNRSKERGGFTSVSKDLVRDLSESLTRFGRVHNVKYDYLEIPKDNGYYPQGSKRKESLSHYLEYTYGRNSKKKRTIYSQDQAMLVRVKEVEEIEFDGEYVYDLEIEDIHYYTANGIIVHNSEGIRRIIPGIDKASEMYNPVPNTMPMTWLPGEGSFRNFLEGDPYVKIQLGEARLPGSSYEMTHDVFYTYPIEGLIMGKSYEEQIAYYSGDIAYQAGLRRNWHIVNENKKEIIGRLAKYMQVVREHDFAYDVKNNVTATVDAIIKGPSGNPMALMVAPMVETESGQEALESGSEDALNAYLVMNERGIREGVLVGLDKDGNITKSTVHADMKRFRQNLRTSLQAAATARKVIPELEEEGVPLQRAAAYSHLNRFKILADVAPFSKEAQMEMKIVREQIDAGVIRGRGKDVYFEAMRQFGKRMRSLETTEYKFIPYMMGKTPIGTASKRAMEEVEEYSPVAVAAGAAYEYLSHLRNPLSNKFISNQSALEMYRSDVAIGKGFKRWQNPIEDYIMSNASMLMAEEDPIQAFISGAVGGAIFGGPVGATVLSAFSGMASLVGLTENRRAERWEQIDEITAKSDALKYEQMMKIYEETGSESALRKAGYTATGVYAEGEVGSYMRVAMPLNPNERKYVKRIMENMYAEDVGQIRDLLPQHIQPVFESQFGNMTDYGATANKMAKYRTAAASIPLDFSYGDVQYQTMASAGFDAHDAGIGWFEQSNRIRYLEASGSAPTDMNEQTAVQQLGKRVALPQLPEGVF